MVLSAICLPLKSALTGERYWLERRGYPPVRVTITDEGVTFLHYVGRGAVVHSALLAEYDETWRLWKRRPWWITRAREAWITKRRMAA